MTVLYVKEQGAIIQKQSERILISKNRKNLLELPLDNIEGITVIGNIQITAPAIRSLMEKGIDISYFSFSGKYLGSTTSDSSKNIFLRLAQYNLYQDLNQRTALAKKIVLNQQPDSTASLPSLGKRSCFYPGRFKTVGAASPKSRISRYLQ